MTLFDLAILFFFGTVTVYAISEAINFWKEIDEEESRRRHRSS